MNNNNERLIEDDVDEREMGEVCEDYMCQFGINLIVARAIPSICDGLKPSIRRAIYMAYLRHRDKKHKVSVAIGDLQTIHPHGDQGAGQMYAGLAQKFANNIPLLDTSETGNSGNVVSGKDAASPRYLEFRLSDFTMKVLFDEFDGKVNMKQSYDYNSNGIMEPVILPSKFPIVLLNGTSGIAYTLSTNIYPYNLNEVADAVIKVLKNPKARVSLVPDLPTGCDIFIKSEDEFIMQSSFDIDHVNYQIIIKNTPYGYYLDDIDHQIRKIQESNDPIKEIIGLDDESDLLNDKFRYVISCKPCNLYAVVNKLFKRVTGFRATIKASNMKVIEANHTVQLYNVNQIIHSWIRWRIMNKRAWFLREQVRYNVERNMLEGKKYMLAPENIEKTIAIFRKSKSQDEIIQSLVKEFKDGKITTSQALAVCDMKMSKLNQNEYKATVQKLKDDEEKLDYIKEVVNDPDKIRDVIIDDMKNIKKDFGSPRKSKIITAGGDNDNPPVGVVQILADGEVLFSETENASHLSSDVTPITNDTVLCIDEYGQFLWVDTNNVENDKRMTLTSIGKGQMGKCVFVASNNDNDILVLTNKGRIKYMPISRIPSNASRKPVIPINSDEQVVSVLEIRDGSEDILVYTTDGFGKRISVSDLNKVLSVEASGQFIIKDKDTAGMFILNSNKPLLCYVTKLGRLRINQTKYLNTVKKFSDIKPIIKLSTQDDLLAVFCVDNESEITLYHADSRISTVNVGSLPVSTNATPPERPKHVPGVKLLRAAVK